MFAVLLFGPAGRLDWWRGWTYLSVIALGTIASSYGILCVDPELLAERLGPPIQSQQSAADKVLLPAMIGLFAATIVVAPIDAFRLRGFPHPGALFSALGFAAVIAGWWIAYCGMRDNAFAAPVVKRQSERGHFVVDTGAYRVVRHPMYAGGMLFMLGTPLWLGSFVALVPALACALSLIARILAEERFLRRALPGYAAYERRVPYRLVPHVW